MENTDLAVRLQDYITELDRTVNMIHNSDFPFDDVVTVYEEVSDRLKQLIAG